LNLDFHYLYHSFWFLTVTGLAQGAIYALVALGYTMVYGVLKLINFAHSEVFLVGTFAIWYVWGWTGLDQNAGAQPLFMVLVYLLLGLAAGAAGSGVTAVLLERVAYRPLRRRNAPSLVFLITAIGASIAISEAVGIYIDRGNRGLNHLVQPKSVFTLGDTQVTNLEIGIVVSAVAMTFALDIFIRRTRLGRGVRAVAQDPDTAALMGVNKDRVFILTFLLGGLLAGGAALLYNLKFATTKFDVGFILGIKAFTAAVLGGIGNLRGALLGGLLIGLVENYGSALFGTGWKNVVVFVALIIILMFRPTGLLGESLGRARA
jgi:branched-chain amino acid transport system permease protein